MLLQDLTMLFRPISTMKIRVRIIIS